MSSQHNGFYDPNHTYSHRNCRRAKTKSHEMRKTVCQSDEGFALVCWKGRRSGDKEMSRTRKAQVGSGDRSERIQFIISESITDHRINLTLYKLDRFMEGDVLDMTDVSQRNPQEQHRRT